MGVKEPFSPPIMFGGPLSAKICVKTNDNSYVLSRLIPLDSRASTIQFTSLMSFSVQEQRPASSLSALNNSETTAASLPRFFPQGLPPPNF